MLRQCLARVMSMFIDENLFWIWASRLDRCETIDSRLNDLNWNLVNATVYEKRRLFYSTWLPNIINLEGHMLWLLSCQIILLDNLGNELFIVSLVVADACLKRLSDTLKDFAYCCCCCCFFGFFPCLFSFYLFMNYVRFQRTLLFWRGNGSR